MAYDILRFDPKNVKPPFCKDELISVVPLANGFRFPFFYAKLLADGNVWIQTVKPQRLPFYIGEMKNRSRCVELGCPITLAIFEIAPGYHCVTYCQPMGEDHAHTWLYRKRGETRIYYWSNATGFRFSVDFNAGEKQWYGYSVDDLFPFETFSDLQTLRI